MIVIMLLIHISDNSSVYAQPCIIQYISNNSLGYHRDSMNINNVYNISIIITKTNCRRTSTAQLIAVGLVVRYLIRSILFLLTSKLSDLLIGKMLK